MSITVAGSSWGDPLVLARQDGSPIANLAPSAEVHGGSIAMEVAGGQKRDDEESSLCRISVCSSVLGVVCR